MAINLCRGDLLLFDPCSHLADLAQQCTSTPTFDQLSFQLQLCLACLHHVTAGLLPDILGLLRQADEMHLQPSSVTYGAWVLGRGWSVTYGLGLSKAPKQKKRPTGHQTKVVKSLPNPSSC